MSNNHNRVINAEAWRLLKPFGLTRKGRSRVWLDDHGWWLIQVEFQPSSWSKGSYLNVGVKQSQTQAGGDPHILCSHECTLARADLVTREHHRSWIQGGLCVTGRHRSLRRGAQLFAASGVCRGSPTMSSVRFGRISRSAPQIERRDGSSNRINSRVLE